MNVDYYLQNPLNSHGQIWEVYFEPAGFQGGIGNWSRGRIK